NCYYNNKRAKKVLKIMPFPQIDQEGNAITTKKSTNNNNNGDYYTLNDMIDYSEIYPGSKIKHFRSIHKNSGIPYSEMIFFDDELRNRNVQRELGVYFVYVKNGLT